MKKPLFTYIIQAQQQPSTTTVQVEDQAELVRVLADMHRNGLLIESVRYVAVSEVDLRYSQQPSEEGSAP